jgi:serine/threonine-protein kinase
VKVLDFGISKIEGNPQDMQLTRTTEIIGSPSYMSPEQLRASRDVDSRTDIWALGVILYELLSTRLPFYGSTVTELVAVVLMEQPPSLCAMRNDLPPELERVVLACLAKDPNQRIQTVVELAQALEPFSAGGLSSFADRVRGVAFQSGRLSGSVLPNAASSGQLPNGIRTSGSLGGSGSARVAVHAGTSVAWGETQIDPPKKSSKAPLFLGLALTLFVVGGGGAAGALYYAKQHTTVATPPADPMPLPSGRKDLPPIATQTATTTAAPPASIAIEAPSSLPDTRLPSTVKSAAPALTGRKGPAGPGTAATPATGKPPAGDDPLSNIGRR